MQRLSELSRWTLPTRVGRCPLGVGAVINTLAHIYYSLIGREAFTRIVHKAPGTGGKPEACRIAERFWHQVSGYQQLSFLAAPEGLEPPTLSLGLTFSRFNDARHLSAVEPK